MIRDFSWYGGNVDEDIVRLIIKLKRKMKQELPTRHDGCPCPCHYDGGIKHVMPCCRPKKKTYMDRYRARALKKH